MHQAGSADVILSQEPLGETVLGPWAMLHTYTPHTLKTRRDQGRLLNSFLRTKAFMGPVVLRTAGFDKGLASARSALCSVRVSIQGNQAPTHRTSCVAPVCRRLQPGLDSPGYRHTPMSIDSNPSEIEPQPVCAASLNYQRFVPSNCCLKAL